MGAVVRMFPEVNAFKAANGKKKVDGAGPVHVTIL